MSLSKRYESLSESHSDTVTDLDQITGFSLNSTHGINVASWDERQAYRRMQNAAASLLSILSDSSTTLEALKDLILDTEYQHPQYFSEECRPCADDLNLIGLIDDLQTYLHFRDHKRADQTRRQLKKKLALWLPARHVIHEQITNLGKTLTQSDSRRDLTAIQTRIAKASQGYVKNRNLISSTHLRLVFRVANKYRYLGLPFDDLVQEGYLGLARAIERFDPDRGYQFSTYAFRVISQTIHFSLDKHAHLVRKPFRQSRGKALVEQTRQRLEQKLGRSLRARDLDKHLPDQLDDKQIHIENNILATADTDKLYQASVNPEHHAHLDESTQAIETQSLKTRATIHQALAALDKRSRDIVRMRYGLGINRQYTLQEISERLSISGERVRQIAKKAVLELRSQLEIEEALTQD